MILHFTTATLCLRSIHTGLCDLEIPQASVKDRANDHQCQIRGCVHFGRRNNIVMFSTKGNCYVSSQKSHETPGSENVGS